MDENEGTISTQVNDVLTKTVSDVRCDWLSCGFEMGSFPLKHVVLQSLTLFTV